MPDIVYYAKTEKREEFVKKILDIFKKQIRGKVFLKPNQVSHEPYPSTTHPIVLRTVGEYAKKMGALVSCGDGHAFELRAKKVKDTAIRQVCDELGIKFIDLYEAPMRKLITATGWQVEMSILPFEANLLISMPVLKSHPMSRMKMSGALKNSVGWISRKERFELHAPIVKSYLKDCMQTIAQINWLLKNYSKTLNHLIIMDGVKTYIKGNELRHGGILKHLGYMMASINPVALDIFGFNLLKRIEPRYEGKTYKYIDYINHAIDLEVGRADFIVKEIKL